MPREMTCEELLQYLSDYIDQDLDEELMNSARRHLATCQNCKVVLDTTQKTIFLFREQSQQTIPMEKREKLFERLEQVFLAKKGTV